MTALLEVNSTPVANCTLKPVDGILNFYLLGYLVRPFANGKKCSLHYCSLNSVQYTLYNVHCTLYMYTVHVHCTCTLYMYTVHVHCTCTLYMYTVHVHCTCTLYMYTVHVHCTCTLYMYTVHCTVYSVHVYSMINLYNRLHKNEYY